MSDIVAQRFHDHDVRRTHDGLVHILDALSVVGIKNPSTAWKRAQKANPELVELAQLIQVGRGRPSPYTDQEGLNQILMVLSSRYLDDQGRKIVRSFRKWLAQTAVRVARADPTLAAEIIDRQQDPQAVRWIARRADHKLSSIRLNGVLGARGCTRGGYRLVHNILNVKTVGLTARQIQAAGGKRTTKDNFNEQELTVHALMQYATVNGIEAVNARGDGQCASVAQDVASDFTPILKKYFGDRRYPQGGLLQVEI